MWKLAVQNQNSDELIHTWSLYTCSDCRSSLEFFPFFEPVGKCMTFGDIFPRLSRTLSFNFWDFPGPKGFSRTFQVLEFSRKKSRTFQKVWEP